MLARPAPTGSLELRLGFGDLFVGEAFAAGGGEEGDEGSGSRLSVAAPRVFFFFFAAAPSLAGGAILLPPGGCDGGDLPGFGADFVCPPPSAARIPVSLAARPAAALRSCASIFTSCDRSTICASSASGAPRSRSCWNRDSSGSLSTDVSRPTSASAGSVRARVASARRLGDAPLSVCTREGIATPHRYCPL